MFPLICKYIDPKLGSVTLNEITQTKST